MQSKPDQLHCRRCATPGPLTLRICPHCGSRDFIRPGEPVKADPSHGASAAAAPAAPAVATHTSAHAPSVPRRTVPLHQARLLSRPIVLAILGTTLAIFLFLLAGGDLLADMAVALTPIEEDRQVTAKNDEYLAALKKSLPESHPLARRVAAIGNKLVQSIPDGTVYNYRFHVVPTKMVNAYAFPGGEIFIHTGLMSIMTSEEQIAAVLAQEIQHVVRRDYLHSAYRGVSRGVLFSVNLGVFADSTPDLLSEFTILSHSRSQESEADLRGLKLLHAAGWPRSAMVDMLNQLAEQGDGGLTWLSTHPDSRDRAAAVAREPLP